MIVKDLSGFGVLAHGLVISIIRLYKAINNLKILKLDLRFRAWGFRNQNLILIALQTKNNTIFTL